MRTFAKDVAQPKESVPSSLDPSSPAVTSAPAHLQHHILQLQRTIGNQAVLRLLRTGRVGQALAGRILPPSRSVIQPKLAVNRPDDEFEKEADHVADQVMRMPELEAPGNGVQRKCACGGTCADCQKKQSEEKNGRLQLKPASGSGPSFAPAAAPRLQRQPGPRCTGIELTLPHKIVLYGSAGPMPASVTLKDELPPGDYNVTYDAQKHELYVHVAGGMILDVHGTVHGTKAQIATAQGKWQAYLDSLVDSPVTLTVRGQGAGEADGASGKGAGGQGTGGKTSTGPGDDAGGGKKGAPKDTIGDGGAPGGKAGGTGTGGQKGPTPGSGGSITPGTSPAPQQGSGGTLVQITDPKQIDELKRRGLLDGKTADDIKNKADKQQPLTFEELIKLYDALSQAMVVHAPDSQKSTDKPKDDWVDVAKFIEANKDKFSGQQATGDGGMTLDEMKQILAKYHEFVGVKDASKPAGERTPEVRIEKFDPQKRKSWNTLADWEKDIWKQYQAKYGEPSMDSTQTDLHLTPEMKFHLALHMSPRFMKEGGREAFEALINDPVFIGGTIAGITLYFAMWLAPEPVFTKLAAVATTLALISILGAGISELKNVAVAWIRLNDESEGARSFPELEEAAKHFGNSIGGTAMRVLLMAAMYFGGKLLPGPKPMGGGGGEMVPAPAGGPPVEGMGGGGGPTGGTGAGATAATGVKVLPDGTVVILGPGGHELLHSSSVSQGGGGAASGGGGPAGGSGGGRGGRGVRQPEGPPKEEIAVKEPNPTQDTQGVKAPRVYGPDVEQQQGVGKQVGNFSHQHYERLAEFTGRQDVVSGAERLQEAGADLEGAKKEYRIPNPSYKAGTEPRIDRLARAGETVIEIKPEGLYEEGLAEAKAYAQEMDKYEKLPDGRKWKAVCLTYNFDTMLDYLESIHYLEEGSAAKFRAKNTPKPKKVK